jgi:hypothetical protein
MAVKTPAPERAAGRRALAARGQALPGGQDPIPDVAYLKKAIRSVGRLDPSKRPALKALIIRRAKELGALDEPGVKGTWAFQGSNDGEAIDLATAPRRMPVIRGAADVQMSRTAPGVISVMHKSSGMKVGTITPQGAGYAGRHADGKDCPASGSQQGALAGLIAYHNQMAAKKNAAARDAASAGTGIWTAMKGYANGAGEQAALDFTAAEAGPVDLAAIPVRSVPAVTSSDGPRVTMMSGGKPAEAAASKLGLSPEAAAVYAKLRKKGLDHGAALSLAKRAAAMHAKAGATPKASAA